MVAPVRDTENKFFSTSAIMTTYLNITLLALVAMNINNFNISNCNNYDDVREYIMSPSKPSTKTVSISSSKALVDYATPMEWCNNLPNDDEVGKPINRSQLSHMEGEKEDNPVSKVTDSSISRKQQCVSNEDPALSKITNPNEHVFNVQIPYNINEALDSESWDGNFYAISLHGLIEYLASNVKHIKELLCWIQKYILNKLIKDDKANDVKDLEGIGEVAWGFISALYKSHWNHLITDKNNFSFRWKVKTQFNPQINRDSIPKKDREIDKPASVSVISPPIPAESPKEVVKISRFFKKKTDNKGKKLYAQMSSSYSNPTRKILKIKEAFPNLQNKKIKNIQKIISRENKPKPKLNMTMKSPSRKQVIVSMNVENSVNFMKDLSFHITNINRALKSIKSDIMADFIHADNRSVVITTTKVTENLDLETIKRYVKNTNNIKMMQVELPRLSQSKSFLKIIGIPYLKEDTNKPITADVVEKIIKNNHIFKNIVLASRPRVIKVLPKSDMSIVWFDIWDAQSGVKAKSLINRCFNMGSYITTIYNTNMNLEVLQYKNCWK